jgi:hypothetical protein
VASGASGFLLLLLECGKYNTIVFCPIARFLPPLLETGKSKTLYKLGNKNRNGG